MYPLQWLNWLRKVETIVTFSISDESILLDLKHLLIEAKQKVPEFLAVIHDENEQYLNIGGMYRASISVWSLLWWLNAPLASQATLISIFSQENEKLFYFAYFLLWSVFHNHLCIKISI